MEKKYHSTEPFLLWGLLALAQFFLVWKISTLVSLQRTVLLAVDWLLLAAVICWHCDRLRDQLREKQLTVVLDFAQKSASQGEKAIGQRIGELAQRAEELEQQQWLICEFGEEILLSISRDGRITYANQAIERYWGLPNNAAIDVLITSLIAPEERDALANMLDAACSSRTAQTGEFKIVSRPEQQCYSRIYLEWSEGKSIFFCLAKDISERVMIQHMKTEVSAMLIHDLQTPVASIGVTLEALSDERFGSLSPAGKDSISSANIGLLQISSMVQRLIILDKSESGELSLFLRQYPLSAILEEAVALVQPLADSRGIVIKLSQDDAIAWCDRDALLQIMSNLLSNALRYVPAAGLIEIQTRLLVAEIEVAVSDHGPGIPDAMKEQVFERYKTLDTGPPLRPGAGLGLAVVKALVKAHGGKIAVRDGATGGAEFYFTLRSENDE